MHAAFNFLIFFPMFFQTNVCGYYLCVIFPPPQIQSFIKVFKLKTEQGLIMFVPVADIQSFGRPIIELSTIDIRKPIAEESRSS